MARIVQGSQGLPKVVKDCLKLPNIAKNYQKLPKDERVGKNDNDTLLVFNTDTLKGGGLPRIKALNCSWTTELLTVTPSK